jgi:hypothetical protein
MHVPRFCQVDLGSFVLKGRHFAVIHSAQAQTCSRRWPPPHDSREKSAVVGVLLSVDRGRLASICLSGSTLNRWPRIRHIVPPLQALAHKLPLREAQPPLTRPLTTLRIQPLMQPDRQLLPNLAQILPHNLRLLPIPRRLKCLIQREPRLSGDRKLFQRAVDERFLRRAAVRGGLHFGQTVRHEEDAVDEKAVGGAFDFEVAEEGVGAEEGEDFVEDVVGFGVRVDVEWVGGGGQRGEGVGGAAGFGAEGEEGEVSCGKGLC